LIHFVNASTGHAKNKRTFLNILDTLRSNRHTIFSYCYKKKLFPLFQTGLSGPTFGLAVEIFASTLLAQFVGLLATGERKKVSLREVLPVQVPLREKGPNFWLLDSGFVLEETTGKPEENSQPL
jgi:hypothetical protein